MEILITTLLGAIFMRIKGGLLPFGGTINAVAFGIFCFCLTWNPWLILVGTACMWLGQSLGVGRYIGALGGWENRELKEVDLIDDWITPLRRRAKGHVIGHDEKGDIYKYDNILYLRLWGFFGLSLRGLLWGICLTPCLWFVSEARYGILFIVSLLMAVCYIIAIEGARLIKSKGDANGNGWIYGEVLFGAVLWAGFYYAITKAG